MFFFKANNRNERFSMSFSKPIVGTNDFRCLFQSQKSKQTIFDVFCKANNQNEQFSMFFSKPIIETNDFRCFLGEKHQNDFFPMFFKVNEHYCNF